MCEGEVWQRNCRATAPSLPSDQPPFFWAAEFPCNKKVTGGSGRDAELARRAGMRAQLLLGSRRVKQQTGDQMPYAASSDSWVSATTVSSAGSAGKLHCGA